MAEVFASPLCLHSMFMRLDLPTLDLPMNANSGLVSFGQSPTLGAEMEYSDFLISMIIIGYFVQS